MLRTAIFCWLLIGSASAAGSYVITAPLIAQRGSDFEVTVVILNATNVKVVATLEEQTFNDGTKITPIVSASGTFSTGSSGRLILPIDPALVLTGLLQLRIRGTGGLQFEQTKFVNLRERVVVGIIQTDKAIYKPEQLVRFRILAVTPDLLLYSGAFYYEVRDPNGNKIKVERNVTSESFVVEDKLQLSDQPVFGTWTIEISTLEVKETTSQTFEVAQFELPLFEVTVETQPYALIRDELLIGKVTAKYTFGQPVEGFVELHVGPDEQPDQCGVLPRSTQIGFEINGNASFRIPREDISRVTSLFDTKKIRVIAFVKEEATGTRLNGTTVVTFYENEYQVKFTENTHSVLKPGLQYIAFIQVTTPDNKPPTDKNIIVSVYTTVNYVQTVADQSLYDVSQFSGNYGLPGQNITVPVNGLVTVDLTIPSNATSITIKAKVNNVQAIKTAQKMFSPSNNYIQVSLANKNIKARTTVTVVVKATEPVHDLFYEVVARGTVAVSGVVDGNGRTSFSFGLEVTTAFAPTSHLLVYYTRGTQEIVADSLAFNVEGIFNNSVTVAFNKNQTQPNQEITLVTTATPGSDIFVLAVDQKVLLLKTGNDITPEKVSTAISQFDDGQKPTDPEFPLYSSATNVRDVFNTVHRNVFTDVETPFPPSPISFDYHPINWGLGMEPYSRSAVLYDSEILAAPVALHMPKQSQLKEVGHTRQYFPEAWLWVDSLACDNGTASFQARVPDSITSWVASAFATHPIAGLGVAPNTALLTVFQAFFVSTSFPTEVVHGEQFVVRAVVFNYMDRDLDVTVTLSGSSNFQSVRASRNNIEVLETGNQVKQIKVNSNDQGVVNFPIMFTNIGIAEIVIAAQATSASDAIRRQIVIKPEGAPVSFNYPLFINLDGQNTFGNSIEFPLPGSAVNGSDRARIKASGDLIGSSLGSLASLVELPTGCGEQSMVKTAPNLYIAFYLQATGQFTGQLKTEIIEFLQAGYQRQLTYQRVDGSFSAFGNSDESGSTWLTAYVLKVFVDVQTITYVDTTFLLRGTDWLVERQNLDGSFNEFGRLLDSSIQGAGAGPALTAFVLLGLMKVQPLATTDCSPAFECARVFSWGNATAKAISNLERLVDSNSIRDQFSLAVVSYALTVANSSRADTVYDRLDALAHREGGLLFWADNSTITTGQTSEFNIWRPPRVQSRGINILITSYALLTLTAKNRIQNALPAVLWLTSQRNPSGGFVSSQDTSVALQALAAYATKTANANTDINIKVSNGATSLAEFNITRENALQLQIKELSRAPPRANVVATGRGIAVLEIAVQFNTNKQLSTPSFEVSTVLIDDQLDSFNLLICTRWLWRRESGMVVQTISIPSGFTPDLESLGNIAGVRRTERRGNTLNVYFDKIGTTSVCYSIRMTRTDKVARTQDNYIITSAYYDPSDRTVSFWQPKRLRESTVCDLCAECCP